jgi:hypothetical protein
VGASFDTIRGLESEPEANPTSITASSSEAVTETTEEAVQQQREYETIYYISCKDGRCSIPRASGLPYDTHCVWTYQGGNAAAPIMKHTYDEHTIQWFSGSNYELQVTCVDEFGSLYYGTEGLRRD